MSDTGQDVAAGTACMPPRKTERMTRRHFMSSRMERMGTPRHEERGFDAPEAVTGHRLPHPWDRNEALAAGSAEEELALKGGGRLPGQPNEMRARERQTDEATPDAAFDAASDLRG